MAPISGRLPASRSPPQPNTTTSLPLDIGPQRLERLRQRVGLVGVVDEDRRAVALADEFEPALGALQLFQRGEDRDRRRRRWRSRAPPRPARSRPGSRRPAAAARDSARRHARRSASARSRRSAPSTRRMPSPLRPTVKSLSRALARGRDHGRRHARDRHRPPRRRRRPTRSLEQAQLGGEIGFERRDDSRDGRARDW